MSRTINNLNLSKSKVPKSPYKGLEPYSKDDALFFFGRENKWQIVTDNLMANKLTLIYGASGVGKSSLLQAGVAYNLMRDAQKNLAEYGNPEFAVIVFNSWQDDPLVSLIKKVETEIKSLLDDNTLETLASYSFKLDQILEKWAERLDQEDGGGELFIILDQFEEYFLYNSNEQGKGTFAAEFPDAVNRYDLPVNFLISIREDSLAKLDRFKVTIPNLFHNYLRVEHLDAKSASKAIGKPIEKYNELFPDKKQINIEENLIKVVVDEVSQVIQSNQGIGVLKNFREELERQIEAPYLQLVMEYLWKEEIESQDSNTLKLETYRKKGGAKKIVSDHLNRQMQLLPKQEGETSILAIARIFQYLVTPSGTRVAYPLKDLAELIAWPKGKLRKLLEKLASGKQRILRAVNQSYEASERYEIFHDFLAQPILEWCKQYLLDEEKSRHNLSIKQGLPAQSIHQLKLGQYETAALLACQAYRFYQKEQNKVAHQIDEVLREVLCKPYFSNVLRGHQSGLLGISTVAFNPQNCYVLASADYNGIIRIWDLHRLPEAYEPRTLKIEDNISINTLAFSPDGKILASGSDDGKVRLWDIEQSEVSLQV